MTYQSSSYNFERRERKTVILDVADTASARSSGLLQNFLLIFWNLYAVIDYRMFILIQY